MIFLADIYMKSDEMPYRAVVTAPSSDEAVDEIRKFMEKHPAALGSPENEKAIYVWPSMYQDETVIIAGRP